MPGPCIRTRPSSAVHGDFTQAEAVAAVTKVFGNLGPFGPKQKPITFPVLKSRSRRPASSRPSRATSPKSWLYFVFGNTTPRSKSRPIPTTYAVQVLNEVLSGSFSHRGCSPPVRTQKGLAYSVGGAVGSATSRASRRSRWSTSTKTSTTRPRRFRRWSPRRNAFPSPKPPTADETHQVSQTGDPQFVHLQFCPAHQ